MYNAIMNTIYMWISVYVSLCILSGVVVNSQMAQTTNWKADAQWELLHAINLKKNTNMAKNVILFIGDGMGVSTVTAARILRGQLEGRTGEETVLEFEKFPYVGMAKTYANNKQTPDSASTASALMCGEKTNAYTLGVNDQVQLGDCAAQQGNELTCIPEWFQKAGRSAGLVSTARITHATPAASFAKVPHRNWENDAMMVMTGGQPECRKDIAHQLVFNSSFKVILGGGRMSFLRFDDLDPERGNSSSSYQRRDVNLIEEWLKLNSFQKSRYVWNKAQFDAVDPETTDSLLGLFESSHMQFELDRNSTEQGEPSLAEMTEKAIEMLEKDRNGYFLLVEGGRIDHAHHNNNAKRALYDVLALEDAVKVAVQLTNEKDTLMIVTADHSHVFNIAGYPSRGNDIFGVSNDPFDLPPDGVPYTTLGYGNGPGSRRHPRVHSYVANSGSNDYQQEAAIPLPSETHAGEDVTVYARGPMSHLIHGIHEQHYIAHVMAYAACVGEDKKYCTKLDQLSTTSRPESPLERTTKVSTSSPHLRLKRLIEFIRRRRSKRNKFN